MIVIIAKIFLFLRAIINRGLKIINSKKFGTCDKTVCYMPIDSIFDGLENIYIGENTYIGPKALFYSSKAKILIGKNVVFGPCVTIITGDHRIDKIGSYIIDVKDKLPENDRDVVIEDDVWIGANVTILKGCCIGRGSIVAAGSVVTKSFPPYSIIGGVAAKIIRKRFNEREIIEHEEILYKILRQ